MDKLITISGTGRDGEQLVQALFSRDGAPLEKVASTSAVDPRVARFISKLKSTHDKLYVLVNALGAGEYYGSNANGDYFEEEMLNPAQWDGVRVLPATPDVYGYQTFFNAGIYRHHRNKDKTKSYGEVVHASYNPRMHRVELVIALDRAKAREMGHGALIEDLDAGMPAAVSMGARVKYDVCSICGNKAPKRSDYCIHAKTMLNTTLPDGRKVYLLNPRPRFFDLSFVLIGADRSAFSMAKVANKLSTPFIGHSVDAAIAEGITRSYDRNRVARRLRVKLSAHRKDAEIRKQLPAVAEKVRPAMEASETDIPLPSLRSASQLGSLPEILRSLTMAGVVLKPREYQTIVLIKARRPSMACRMHRDRQVFSPVGGVDRSIGIGGNYQPLIANLLRSIIAKRTVLGGQLEKRAGVECGAASVTTVPNSPLLEKVAEGYNGYRQQLLEEMPSLVETFTSRNPELLSIVLDPSIGGLFSGHSKEAGVPTALMGALPLAYLYGAHVRKSMSTGKKAGVVDRFVEKHPVLATSIFVGLTRFGSKLAKSGQFSQFLAKL